MQTHFCKTGSQPKPSSPQYIDVNTGFLCQIFEVTGWFCPLLDRMLPQLPLPLDLLDGKIPNKWGQLAKAFKRLNNAYNLIDDVIDITKKIIPTSQFCSVEPEEIQPDDNVTFDETLSAIIGIEPGASIFWDKMARVSARLWWDKYCQCRPEDPVPNIPITPDPSWTCTLPPEQLVAETQTPGRCALNLFQFYKTYVECHNAYVREKIASKVSGGLTIDELIAQYNSDPNSHCIIDSAQLVGDSTRIDEYAATEVSQANGNIAQIYGITAFIKFPDKGQNSPFIQSNWSQAQLNRMPNWYDSTDSLYRYLGNEPPGSIGGQPRVHPTFAMSINT